MGSVAAGAHGRVTLADNWLLDRSVTFLNHGSFGACPLPVLEAQAELRARMEHEPVRFLDHGLGALLAAALARLAEFARADPADLAFVPNATTGVNTVLWSLVRSTWLGAGDEILTTDHEYNACLNTCRAAAESVGARVVVARVPFPLASANEVVAAVLEAVGPRTRLALLSHITSPTALVWPIEQLVGALAERGVDVLVDGAHAPGMVPLAIASLDAAYYTGNCHKWLCAPKGSAFLWVRRDRQDLVRPLIVSHGANAPERYRSRFRLEFEWTGTTDPTPFLCVPTAIDFVGSLLPGGWPAVMEHNRTLALAARQLLLAALEASDPAPDDMIGAMAAVMLPADLGEPAPQAAPDAPPGATYPPDPLHELLWARFGIEVPVSAWPHTPDPDRPRLRLLRVSAQLYNSVADYVRLTDALDELRGRSPKVG
jgi:isopenicillin-N epimerase